MAIPVHTLDSEMTAVVDEVSNNDAIYNGQNHEQAYGTYVSCIDDFEYQHHDTKRSIFTNISKHISVICNNNMVLPVRYKRSLDGIMTKSQLEQAFKVKNIGKGVFIVDYYYIYNNSTTDIKSILEHYANSNTLEFASAINQEVVNKLIQKKSKNRPPIIELRLITYIPEASLLEHGYVYSNSTNLLIVNGELRDSLYHPSSLKYKEDVKDITDDFKNVIVLDIIDNDSDKQYFLKVGNSVYQMYSSKDNSRKNGAVLTVKKNGGKENIVTNCSLEQVGEIIGAFTTREKADTLGNMSLVLEERKLTIEKEKFNLELAKMNHEKQKLEDERNFYRSKYKAEMALQEHKLKIADFDMRAKVINLRIDQEKMLMSMSQLTHKHVIEMEHLFKKNDMELIKMSADTVVKVLTTLHSVFKTWLS